jgi:hypothetical protein
MAVQEETAETLLPDLQAPQTPTEEEEAAAVTTVLPAVLDPQPARGEAAVKVGEVTEAPVNAL